MIPKLHNQTSATRIVSLVPSQTELLFDLGLEEEVIGITKFCIHPHIWYKTKQRVGGTKKLNLEIIDSLHPDLIIANKEENTKEDIEALAKKYPIYLSDVSNVNDALEMIHEVGMLVGKQQEALQIINEIISLKQKRILNPSSLKTLYLIWYNPYMAAGSDTFIHSMLQEAGFPNCLAQKRYPELCIKEIIELNPDLIFLSSEPFPFKQKHIDELQNLLPNSKIVLVDGELFSWYGSRMLKSFDYFSQLNESIR